MNECARTVRNAGHEVSVAMNKMRATGVGTFERSQRSAGACEPRQPVSS
jgi:hypothetical protein